MKKVIVTLMTTLLVLSSLCAASKKSLSLEPIEFDLPSEKGSEFNYAIDPRVEVIGVICRLAGDDVFLGNYNGEDILTQNDLIFEKYKDHKAVKAIKDYSSQKQLSGDVWLNLAYFIKPDFSGTTVDFKPYPADLNPELKKLTASQLNTLVTYIHDFAVDTNFSRICILNRGTYMSDFGWMKENVEKCMVNKWGKDFFNDSDVPEVNITFSRYVVGGSYYDFVNDETGKRIYYMTIYPGAYLSTIVMDYSVIYGQLYANDNWDTVKDNFTKYIKDFSKKSNPDKAKEIDKEEIYGDTLAYVLTNYFFLDYCNYRAEHQTEEDIEEYGDFAQTVDSNTQYLEKAFGNNATNAIKLLKEYRNNRDKYPDFKHFYPELNKYVNTLKEE